MPDDTVLSLAEAAELTGIAHCTLRRWRDDRRFLVAQTDWRVGKTHRYKLEDILRVAEEHKLRKTGYLADGYITLPEASRILKVNYMVVRYRAQKGHYGAKQIPWGTLKQWVVVREIIEAHAGVGDPRDYRSHDRPLVACDDDACLAARREKFERDGRRINFERLINEWRQS